MSDANCVHVAKRLLRNGESDADDNFTTPYIIAIYVAPQLWGEYQSLLAGKKNPMTNIIAVYLKTKIYQFIACFTHAAAKNEENLS